MSYILGALLAVIMLQLWRSLGRLDEIVETQRDLAADLAERDEALAEALRDAASQRAEYARMQRQAAVQFHNRATRIETHIRIEPAYPAIEAEKEAEE